MMLKSDEPQGTPNPVWIDICSQLEINYTIQPKKFQNNFRKERVIRQALYRLTKKGYLKPILIANNDSIASPSHYGYAYYSLTTTGRIVAEKLNQEVVEEDLEDIQKVLAYLRDVGNKYVTVLQVREMLWQGLLHEFDSRTNFEHHWNNTKIGRILAKCLIRRERIDSKDRRKRYYFEP